MTKGDMLVDDAWLREKIAADRDVDTEAGTLLPSPEDTRERIARLEADLALSESMRVTEHAELLGALRPFAEADECDHRDFETARAVFDRAVQRRKVRLP